MSLGIDNNEPIGTQYKLKCLDLDPKETQVLASLFFTGQPTVTQIAENSGLKRPHAYNVLRSLESKGLAHSLVKNKVIHYTAAKPEALLGYLQLRKNALSAAEGNIETLLPVLAQLLQPTLKRPHIRFLGAWMVCYQSTTTR